MTAEAGRYNPSDALSEELAQQLYIEEDWSDSWLFAAGGDIEREMYRERARRLLTIVLTATDGGRNLVDWTACPRCGSEDPDYVDVPCDPENGGLSPNRWHYREISSGALRAAVDLLDYYDRTSSLDPGLRRSMSQRRGAFLRKWKVDH